MIEKRHNLGTLNINCAESPSTGKPLLLLHGLTARWQEFLPIIPHLEKEWHIYAPDFRGHGQSDRAESYKIQDNVPDVAFLIKNVIREPVVVFGHSLGGMVGIMVAARHPELVKALILGDSLLSVEFLKEHNRKQKEKSIWWRELAKNGNIEYIVEELKRELIPVPGGDELVPAAQVLGENHSSFKHAAACFSQVDPEVLTANLEGLDETYAQYRVDQLLPLIKCPVLILQANPSLGGLMRDEDVEMALNLLPKGQHVKIDRVGHMLHLEDRQAVLKAIMPFLDSVTG